MGTTTQRSVNRSSEAAAKAAAAAKLKADGKAPMSQSAAILKPFIVALDEAIATETKGGFALFDYAEKFLAKAGKDRAFGADPLPSIEVIMDHYYTARGKKPLKEKKSRQVTLSNWRRFYDIGEYPNGFANLAVVREALGKRGGHIWNNAGKMMTYAVAQSKAGRSITVDGCVARLVPKAMTLEDELRAYNKSTEARVKRDLDRLDKGDEDIFPREVLLLMRKAAQAALDAAEALRAADAK